MNGIESILENLRLLVVQYVPTEGLKQAVPFALVCLVAGIGLSVLGAKLARFGFVCALALGGAVLGTVVARGSGYPLPVCGMIGAVMAGTIAYQTFRFWVGTAAAVVLASVALGMFSYRSVVPQVEAFNQSLAVSAESPGSFVLPTPEQQQAYLDRSPRQWVGELRTFIAQRDAQLEGKGRAVVLAALLSGLCLGVLAVRAALIVSTSLLGTGLVTTGLATLMTQSVPASYRAVENHPKFVGIAVGGFLVTSLIVQTLLTRKAPESSSSDSKSKA